MRLLFLALSRLSRGDAILAADLARALPRPAFPVGFVAAPEAVPQLHDLGMPTLPLAGAKPAGNLAQFDRIVEGFRPDCLVAADAFTLNQSRGWSGLSIEVLRERYGLPVASFDRLGWQAASYTADFYGGDRVRFPRLLDDCDIVIRTSPPHRVGPAPPGVIAAALRLDGLRDSGRSGPGTGGEPTVFLVNSPWEYRNPARSLPVAELIDALPRLIHSHLAALGRQLRVVHVGPRQWRFPLADQIEYRHFSRLPYPMFYERLTSARIFLTTNVLSVTLAQAVLAGTPAVVLHNNQTLGPDDIPGWAGRAAPLLRTAYPFHVAPLGWHDLLEPLLAGNHYGGCFASAGIFDRAAVLRAMTESLDRGPVRHHYLDELAGLPEPGQALRAAVTR